MAEILKQKKYELLAQVQSCEQEWSAVEQTAKQDAQRRTEVPGKSEIFLVPQSSLPRWWNGIHAALKMLSPYGVVGSSPALGTIA